MEIITLPLTKETATAKYAECRPHIKNGDMILYRGTSILARGIQYVDKAYYNHIGVVWEPEKTDRKLTVDMWSDGVHCCPLSRRMAGYMDFCVMRPNVSPDKIDLALRTILNEWDGRDIKYDSLLVLRVALIKKTGIDITGLGDRKKFICSELVQFYVDLLDIGTFSKIELITPQDFIRNSDDNFSFFFDESVE